jgi:Family of unknown function (DUF6356)
MSALLQGQFGTREPDCGGKIPSIETLLRIAMTTRLARLFIEHPASVDETYFGHMAFAGWFAGKLFLAAGAALIHALLPFLFESTASGIIRELYERTHNRGR